MSDQPPPPESPPDPRQQDDRWRECVERLRRGPERPFAEHWTTFQTIYAKRAPADGPPLAWRPDPARAAASNLGRCLAEGGHASYEALHAWSTANRPAFWEMVIARLGIVLATPPEQILDLPADDVTTPRWLAGATLNCVESCFTAVPDRPAIVWGREGTDALETVTYRQLERLTNRVANGFREQGFQAGDGIALYLPMTVECVAAYLGIIRAGGRVVSIADSFPPKEVRRRLRIGEARGMLTVAAFTRAGKTFPLYDTVKEADAPRAIVIPASDGAPPDLRDGDVTWDAFLSESDRCAPVPGDPDTVTTILFSSGTTGDPKAIPWTHLTPIKCAMDGHFHQDIRPSDVVAWPTNIGWMMGPWLIYATLINQATIALYTGAPTGPDFARFVERAGITVLGLVPSLARAWRTTGATEGTDWNNVRVFTSTGEPSNQEDYLWLMSRAGYRAPVIEYCGGTEIGGGHLTGTVVQPASPATFTTPALGVTFHVLDDAGQPVREGGMGELFLVPPAVGLSQTLLNTDHDAVYYRDCPRGPHGEVLRRHGDQVTRLPHGFYRAQGRADDTMNLGGIKVGSQDLEQVLDAHPAVYESAAIAVQPAGGGADRLVVYATLAEPTEPPPADLRKALGKRIARDLNPLFKIHDLVIVEALPRTASNKLMRRTLRDRYLQEQPGA